jgi:hypothetical protein
VTHRIEVLAKRDVHQSEQDARAGTLALELVAGREPVEHVGKSPFE